MRFKGGYLTAPLLCAAGGAHGRGPRSGNGFSLVLKVQILEPLVGQSAEKTALRSDACSSDASKGADAYCKEWVGWVGWWDGWVGDGGWLHGR